MKKNKRGRSGISRINGLNQTPEGGSKSSAAASRQESTDSQGLGLQNNDDSKAVRSLSSSQHAQLAFHHNHFMPPLSPSHHPRVVILLNCASPPHGYTLPTMYGQPYLLPKNLTSQVSSPLAYYQYPIKPIDLLQSTSQVCKEEKPIETKVSSEGKGARKNRGLLTKRLKVDENDEKLDGVRWKDYWVDQLIHIRGGMHEEFRQSSKPGVNLWLKVATQVASICPDFNRDSESCRKKWDRVYKQYKCDKAHNQISGKDCRRYCRWYDVVDEYMHKRANVKCVGQASSSKSSDDGEKQVPIGIAEDEDSPKENSQAQKKVGSSVMQKIDKYFGKMVDTGDALLEHMRATSLEQLDMKKNRLRLFHEMMETMQGFLQAYEKRNLL